MRQKLTLTSQKDKEILQILTNFSTFQHILAHFSTFQHILAHISAYQRVLDYFSSFQHVLACFRTLQPVLAINIRKFSKKDNHVQNIVRKIVKLYLPTIPPGLPPLPSLGHNVGSLVPGYSSHTNTIRAQTGCPGLRRPAVFTFQPPYATLYRRVGGGAGGKFFLLQKSLVQMLK